MGDVKAVVLGAHGKMGRQIIEAIFNTKGIVLEKTFELLGKSGDIILSSGENIIVFVFDPASFSNFIEFSDVIIDFTSPESTMKVTEIAKSCQKPMVIGTTGLKGEVKNKIIELAKIVPVVQASNMSIGINLLFAILPRVVKALSSYDVEISELHHRHKKDAPSGTAMKLAEIIALDKWTHTCNKLIYGREGMVGERTKDEIGILASRGGEVPGEHTIMFLGPAERVELIHRAQSRDTFAFGAVEAAFFVVNQKPGLYDMQDVLGLK